MHANATDVAETGKYMPSEQQACFAIRSFRPPDAAHVLALWREGLAYGHAPAAASTRAIPTEQLLIWVAEGSKRRLIGALAAATAHEQVAHLLWLYVAAHDESGRPVAEQLVAEAMRHVCERGALKLVVHTPLDAAAVAGFFHRLGLGFSRERGTCGTHVLEFYFDFYKDHHGHKRPARPH